MAKSKNVPQVAARPPVGQESVSPPVRPVVTDLQGNVLQPPIYGEECHLLGTTSLEASNGGEATLGSVECPEGQEITPELQAIMDQNSAAVDEMLAKSPAGDDSGDSDSASPMTVLIEVPVAPFDPTAFRSRFLTMRLSQRQADALKCIAAGLKQSHEMLRNEKHVDTPPQAIQWVLEQAATAIEQPAA